MKRMVAIGLVVVAGCGFLAVKSFVYAADRAEPVQPARTVQPVPVQAEVDNETAWPPLTAWAYDFDVLLGTDEGYKASEDALYAYEGDDEAERARLEAVLDDRYRELALGLYEKRFGAWDGTDAEFDELVAGEVPNPHARLCTAAALKACGKGKVCWAQSTETSCTYACQDGNEGCPVMPAPTP